MHVAMSGATKTLRSPAPSLGTMTNSVRAVHEGIAVSPVALIEQLRQAVDACGHVRSDQDAPLAGSLTGDDDELGVAAGRQPSGVDAVDHRERRGLPSPRVLERRDVPGGAFHPDEHALPLVS